ncbi:MAG: hypothetical protein SGJ18_14490 [Pseudomonadota bacterium]|nr:hypothetical protein [Pseudomonadota bacterium]
MIQSILVFLIIGLDLNAQAQVLAKSSSYKSEVDESLTISRITLLPFSDNVDGIYAKPVEATIKESLSQNHHYSFISSSLAGNIVTPRELEADPEKVKSLGKELGVDAFIAARMSKGPKGIGIQMSLFLTNDGRLLAQEQLKNFSRFELAGVINEAKAAVQKLLGSVPYDGRILSRDGLRVTLNLGKRDGLDRDKVVSIIQITKAVRHPKFNFLISTEKEIIGTVKIQKSDDTISFGSIISEKEKGVISKNSKISGLNPVTYSAVDAFGAGASEKDLLAESPDSLLSFGANPELWIPRRPPQYGQVGFNLGLSNYSGKINPQTSGPLEMNSSYFAGVGMMGEIWLNHEWATRAQIRQSVFSTNNPITGSTPEKLSVSLRSYELAVNYNFLLEEEFFSSKIELRGGFGNFTFDVDHSDLLGFTSTDFNGLLFGVKGLFPITKQKDWLAAAEMNIFLNPGFKERPVNSGHGGKNTITDYVFTVSRLVTSHLYIDGAINATLLRVQFDSASNRTSGGLPDSATNISQRLTTYSMGFRYLF